VKVVYVSSLPWGGPVTHLRDLVPQVADAGVDVSVLCQTASLAAMFGSLGVPARTTPLSSKWDLPGAAKLWRRLDGADIVHSHDRRTGLLARPLARLLGAHVVHTLHGLPEEIAPRVGPPDVHGAKERATLPGTSRARALWLERGIMGLESVLGRLGTVVVPSHALACYLLSSGFPSRRLEVLPSGIEVRRDTPGPPNEPLVVGTATQLQPRKGVDVLVAAWGRLDERVRSGAELHIYGDGPLREDLCLQAGRQAGEQAGRQAVRQGSRREEPGGGIRFLGRTSDAGQRIAGFDVFVLPSRGENLPIAILEAMANAVPVIATRVGGVPELVVHGETGLLVEPDDPGALADAIDTMVRQPSLRKSMGEAGARRARRHFDAKEAGSRMVALYRRLCGSSR
jgi:glycosyltransferase involved in cell wall biosynthesis